MEEGDPLKQNPKPAAEAGTDRLNPVDSLQKPPPKEAEISTRAQSFKSPKRVHRNLRRYDKNSNECNKTPSKVAFNLKESQSPALFSRNEEVNPVHAKNSDNFKDSLNSFLKSRQSDVFSRNFVSPMRNASKQVSQLFHQFAAPSPLDLNPHSRTKTPVRGASPLRNRPISGLNSVVRPQSNGFTEYENIILNVMTQQATPTRSNKRNAGETNNFLYMRTKQRDTQINLTAVVTEPTTPVKPILMTNPSGIAFMGINAHPNNFPVRESVTGKLLTNPRRDSPNDQSVLFERYQAAVRPKKICSKPFAHGRGLNNSCIQKERDEIIIGENVQRSHSIHSSPQKRMQQLSVIRKRRPTQVEMSRADSICSLETDFF